MVHKKKIKIEWDGVGYVSKIVCPICKKKMSEKHAKKVGLVK